MRAVRIYQYGGPDTLRYEDDVPNPAIGPDAVLIESNWKATGRCRS